MANLGKYCKAYPVKRLREFSGWVENLQNLRADRAPATTAADADSKQLTDDDYLYVQEDFNVTDGVFIDANIIFDDVTPEWKDFCVNILAFEVPVYGSATPN